MNGIRFITTNNWLRPPPPSQTPTGLFRNRKGMQFFFWEKTFRSWHGIPFQHQQPANSIRQCTCVSFLFSDSTWGGGRLFIQCEPNPLFWMQTICCCWPDFMVLVNSTSLLSMSTSRVVSISNKRFRYLTCAESLRLSCIGIYTWLVFHACRIQRTT